MPLAIPTMSALSPELATLATEEASMESARLTPTPSDKSLTGFPWPMLTPPDTLTTLALSPESASPATGTGMEQESTTASARLRRTLSGRLPMVAPEELLPVLITATEPLETVGSAMQAISTDEQIFLLENISGPFL